MKVDSYWNYRLVLLDVTSPDEPWVEIKEVFYDGETHKPTGFGAPCTGGEDTKELQQTYEWIGKAFDKPVLKESDFNISPKKEV